MSTTLFAAIALVGSLTPSAKPDFRAQTDYPAALRQASAEKKPVMVLIGKGDQFAKLLADSGMSADAAKLLREKFVCVTVDVETAAGAKLAGDFQLTEGLVISSAGGSHQALRQPGTVTAADLAKHTGDYANTAATPATTVTAAAPASAPVTVTPAYTPAYSPPVPTSYPPVGSPIYPAGGFGIPPSPFNGLSPNGRCLPGR